VERSIAALRAEGAALDPVLGAVRAEQWSQATRLERWNVRQLAAHLLRGVDRIHAYLQAPVPPRPDLTWLGYWRRANEDADHEGIAQRSIDEAARLDTTTLASRWQESWRSAAVESEAVGPDRVMPVPFGAMRLDHYLSTRLLEVVVHGLDLRQALGLEEVATPQGTEVAAAVCDGLLGVPRPVRLERDAVGFVLAATGRVPTEDPDLPVLT
jgi:uncharacterized protein (TIGR03083 family)